MDTLSIHTPLNHKYLGLRSLIGKNKWQIFSFLKDRLSKCIFSWNNRFLSRAGKEILLKTMAQAIPTYYMGFFLISLSIYDELQKMMNSFWWGLKKDGKRSMHWLSWEWMCSKKFCGGLGFHNLHYFNLAMLGK